MNRARPIVSEESACFSAPIPARSAPSPFVSFVVPFYGSAARLRSCLDSFVVQTDGDFEVIVVDDASPEDAERVVAQYDARFRHLLQPENLGPYQGRVRGVAKARGEYVVDVDCDDYVLPGLVAELRKAAARSRADVIVYNVEQDVNGRIEPHWCRYEPGVYTPADVLERFVAKRLQWNFWAKAIRRETMAATWAVEPQLRTTRVLAPDDFCAIVPTVLQSEKIEVIGYVGYRYWQGADSICRSVTWRKVRKALRDTREAERLVLSFAAAKGADAATRAQIREMARMIRSWWRGELIASFKKQVKRMLGR